MLQILQAIMPTIVEVSDEELQRLLGDGGLKPATLARRKRSYEEVPFNTC